MGRSKSYSIKEDTYIKENYRDLFDDEIAVILDRPIGSITRRRQRLGCWYIQQEITAAVKGERWVPIKGLPSHYKISNMGRIKSGKKQCKLYVNKAGYAQWRLVNHSKLIGESFKVHRLVAYHFLPEDKRNNLDVHHIDKNLLNNRFDNLMFVTKKEHRDLHK